MYSEKQRKILEDLDKYVSETPSEMRKEYGEAISALKFEGVSALKYFEYFEDYFECRQPGTAVRGGDRIEVGSKDLNSFRSFGEIPCKRNQFLLTL